MEDFKIEKRGAQTWLITDLAGLQKLNDEVVPRIVEEKIKNRSMKLVTLSECIEYIKKRKK